MKSLLNRTVSKCLYLYWIAEYSSKIFSAYCDYRFDRRLSINRTLSFVTEGTKFTYQNIKKTRNGAINYLHARGPLLGPLVILASSTEVCKFCDLDINRSSKNEIKQNKSRHLFVKSGSLVNMFLGNPIFDTFWIANKLPHYLLDKTRILPVFLNWCLVLFSN